MEDLDLNPRFWSRRRALVTGHTGFKGAWTTLWLRSMGAEVTGYALRPPTQPNLFELAAVRSSLDRSIEADVRDASALRQAFDVAKPEVVVHLAAQSLVHESYASPALTFETNVMGTVNTLEAARACSAVRAVVIVTTDKCYDNQRSRACREDDPLGGRDPYSASKACAELAAGAYRQSYFSGTPCAIATARAGNVIGGGDFTAHRLVPDVVRAAHAGCAVLLRHPHSVRPWQHVLDAVCGYLLLAERLFEAGDQFAEGWNFGPDEEAMISVQQVTERALRYAGSDAGWLPDKGGSPYEAAELRLDSAKARARLGWRTRLGIDEALQWTMQWYGAHREGADLHAVTQAQIAEYMEKLAR